MDGLDVLASDDLTLHGNEVLMANPRLLVHLVQSGELSPVEVVETFLRRIEAVNPSINAIVALRSEEALSEAKSIEGSVARGASLPLAGLAFTVKDTIDVAGMATTAGSMSRAEAVAELDAPLVAALRSRGAILLGKTNTPEFAMTFSTDNSLFGRTGNPRDLGLTSGGSSGGEAAIIASGGSPLGLGTDLGGSIRVPAHFCGIAGLRPSVGRLPVAGQVPHLPQPFGELSVIGPMSRYVDGIEMVLDCFPVLHQEAERFQRDDGKSIAFFVDDGVTPTTRETRHGLRDVVMRLSDEGWRVEEVRPPDIERLYRLWDEIWAASGGAAGLLSEYLNAETELSRPLSRMVDASTPRDEPRLWAAAVELGHVRDEVARFMEQYPVVLAPVAAGPATERAGRWVIDGEAVGGAKGFGYSYVWSLLGCPALALPVSRSSSGLPIGTQIIARPKHDQDAIKIGKLVESSFGPRDLAPAGVDSIY